MNHRQMFLVGALVVVGILLGLGMPGERVSLAAGTIIYVDADANGATNGSSWVDAFTDLQSGLDAAVSGDQIWVAEGTYKPTVAHGGASNRYYSFQMKNSVAIYGGFSGSESNLDERDWVTNETILSGDIGIEGSVSDNSYHVFYHPDGTNLDSSAILDGFTIRDGYASLGDGPDNVGGGMHNFSSSPKLVNCIFFGNSADGGGGIYNYTSSPILINCVFHQNTASNGGGIFNDKSNPILTNCTLTGNSVYYDGGAIYNYYSNPTLTNSIIWGNSPNQLSGYSSIPDVTYSDVQGGYAGTGNIAADPLFVDAANDDFHLTVDSPCIDVGNNTAQYLPSFDFEGDDRIRDGNGDGISIVDMGVDEAYYEATPSTVFYVDIDASGANDGTSWVDAFTALQPALDATASGDQIWVAEGSYNPTQELVSGDPRSATFQMKNRVAIYGGFSGGESNLEERDWVINITILSGDLNGDDGPDYSNNAENSYHVLYSTSLNSSAILDGFTITGGNANGEYPHLNGGGMYNTANSTPTLTNCILTSNSAYQGGGMFNDSSMPILTNCTLEANRADYGGGMYNQNSSPVLTNCTFIDNSVGYGEGGYYGGGMYNYSNSSPTLINCIFTNNSADAGGGIFNNSSSSPDLNNCIFSDNSASYSGGGIFNTINSSPMLINCIFSGNTASYGGGIYNSNSTPSVINCTFSGNLAGDGGGIYDSYYLHTSSTVVTNSILWGNSTNEIATYGGSTYVTYSDVQGGYAGTGNINTDPLFVDALNGDFHLSPGSPALDSGNNAASFLPLIDFEGDARILDGNRDGVAIVDMGVDEALWYYTVLPLVVKAD